MHFRSVLFVLGSLLALLGMTMIVPLAVALIVNDVGLPLEQYEVLSFVVAIATSLVFGLGMRTLFKADLSHVGNREGVAIVSLIWVIFSLVGCLPFVITGAAGFTDAYFETMSGFTTTGASIFSTLEVLPHGLMLWRCQTQWMGGMGIVVLSVAILPILGVGGYRMFKAEVPGGSTFERNAPRIKDTAKVLWMIYLLMTVLEIFLLKMGSMGFFDAICHAFTTMSTGGFSSRTASLAAWPSPFIQWVIILFMFMAGVNFSIYQQLITNPNAKVLDNQELKVYAYIFGIVVAVHFGVLLRAETVTGGTESVLRAASFQVASIGTTTGYATEDFDRWPDILRLLLLLMMFVGGCTGSTGGGIKVARLVIIIKSVIVELRHTINPRAVLVVWVGDRALDRTVVANIMGFLAMYIGLFAFTTLALTLMGLDLTSATSAAAANIGNIGPGLGSVGPTGNFAHVPLPGKWLLIACQLLGRLELYSVMSLLLKRTWVR